MKSVGRPGGEGSNPFREAGAILLKGTRLVTIISMHIPIISLLLIGVDTVIVGIGAKAIFNIYKPQTQFPKIQGNISGMNQCRCASCDTGRHVPETLLGATPVTAMRVFRVNLETLTLHSLNSGRALNGMGEAWIPGETKTATCAIHAIHNLIRFGILANAYREFYPNYTDKLDAHDAPVWGCSCGIWSCKSREALAKTLQNTTNRVIYLKNKQAHGGQGNNKNNAAFANQMLYVSAQVYQWGRVIEHTSGYRSQYARIIPESIQIYPRNIKTTRDKKLVETLRRKYRG